MTRPRALAPKSNALYSAWGSVRREIGDGASDPVPLRLRNAPTALMKQQGYGRDYHYPHDEADAFVAERNLPEALGDARFYEPTERGAEGAIAARLRDWRERRERSGKS